MSSSGDGSVVLPRYEAGESYRWNYEHAPEPVEREVAEIPGEWTFCGRTVPSPLGMPAGPLLNGKWVLYYASLGFDVLTYKTVRSVARECYPLPNLQPVDCGPLSGGERQVPATESMNGSWAVSFGMPSMEPEVWRRDIEATRERLAPEKLLSVSVVGTVQPDWGLEELAADYAVCARWARESGADAVETNFSCPNVSTCDGQLYQNPHDAAAVADAVREAIGAETPYIAKIGHVQNEVEATLLIETLAPFVDAFAMTNSVAATVDRGGELLFDGQPRGICGAATRKASLGQTALFSRLIGQRGMNLRLIGVGGASTAEHVKGYLDAGAEHVQIASAAMVDPETALSIRRNWST